MNVAIDVTPLESGHKLRGIGSYTQQLIEALEKHKSEHSFSFFTRGQKVPENVDLVHYPYFDPFFLTLPLTKPKPTVVTVHDLIPIANAEHFPRGLRGELKWQAQKLSLKGVAAIVTDSEASKRDIARLIGFPQNMIHVVYLAPSSVYRQIRDSKILKRVRDTYLLPKRYVLYVGDVNWNKNISGLLRAFANVRQNDHNIDLIFVGKQFLNNDLPETTTINNLVKDLSLEDHIHKLGYVKNSDLVALYTLATVYAQPSFAEGFGFPILEAMSCGCPVVCANTSSLTEIAGPSKLVNPCSIEDIANGILTVLNFTKTQRDSVTKEGLRWAKNFNWEKVAKETVRIYESIVE